MKKILRDLKKIKEEYRRGTNIIRYIKRTSSYECSQVEPILISYDLQSGNYIENVEKKPTYTNAYSQMIADLIASLGIKAKTLMEVGAGELTTLAHVVKKMPYEVEKVFGFDISLSRIYLGKRYYEENCRVNKNDKFFVADLFNIPIADNSIDVVYSSHSIEPNGGREREALKELIRITKNYLVLLEPSFENACEEGKKRMAFHGYIRGLKEAINETGYKLIQCEKSTYIANPLNPTWIYIIEKNKTSSEELPHYFICPITKEPLIEVSDSMYVPGGVSYPIVHKTPYLLETHAILSTKVGS